ncbi:MAG: hypothetical protein QRY71_02030 [Candidatus Rhabdochlamydia sp.]
MMALKGNHKTLFEDIIFYFQKTINGISYAQSIEKNRGKVETRACMMASADWIEAREPWKGLKTILKVKNTIFYEGKETKEERYY